MHNDSSSVAAHLHITGDDLEPPDPAPETYLAYPPTLKQHVLYTSRMTTYCASRDECAKSRGDSEHSMDQLAQCFKNVHPMFIAG